MRRAAVYTALTMTVTMRRGGSLSLAITMTLFQSIVQAFMREYSDVRRTDEPPMGLGA